MSSAPRFKAIIHSGKMNSDDGICAVADLTVGQTARVVSIGGTADVQRRLREMGLTDGAAVRLVRVAPLGDPIELAVRGYRLSIRRSEAARVSVVRLIPDPPVDDTTATPATVSP